MTVSRVSEGKQSVLIIWSEGTREAREVSGESLLPFMCFHLALQTCSLCLPGWFSPLVSYNRKLLRHIQKTDAGTKVGEMSNDLLDRFRPIQEERHNMA